MNKMIQTIALASFSIVAFTGCPGGGGGGGGPVATAPVTAGPTPVGVVNNYNNESCNILVNSYSCSQNSFNGNLITQQINFSSLSEFCQKIMDYQVNLSQTGIAVAQMTRSDLYRTRCQNITPTPTNPQNPQPTQPGFPQVGLKNFKCQLQARKGNYTFDSQAIDFSLLNSGGSYYINANYFRFFKRINVAKLLMKYTPAFAGSPTSMDTISMIIENVDGDTSASITGFAGSENRIEMTPDDATFYSDRTQIIASCMSTDGAQAPAAPVSSGKYQCSGIESVNGKTTEIKYTNEINDVVNSGISLSQSVFVQGQQAGIGSQDLVQLSQTMSDLNESQVVLKSKLLAPVKMMISKIGYSLNVTCSPK